MRPAEFHTLKSFKAKDPEGRLEELRQMLNTIATRSNENAQIFGKRKTEQPTIVVLPDGTTSAPSSITWSERIRARFGVAVTTGANPITVSLGTSFPSDNYRLPLLEITRTDTGEKEGVTFTSKTSSGFTISVPADGTLDFVAVYKTS